MQNGHGKSIIFFIIFPNSLYAMQDSQKQFFAELCHLIISNGSGVIGSLKPGFLFLRQCDTVATTSMQSPTGSYAVA